MLDYRRRALLIIVGIFLYVAGGLAHEGDGGLSPDIRFGAFTALFYVSGVVCLLVSIFGPKRQCP